MAIRDIPEASLGLRFIALRTKLRLRLRYSAAAAAHPGKPYMARRAMARERSAAAPALKVLGRVGT